MKKWHTEITKNGTDFSILNGDYTLYLGDAFDGTPLRFNEDKALKLNHDANLICNILNDYVKENEHE
jgi:hypothetical protein